MIISASIQAVQVDFILGIDREQSKNWRIIGESMQLKQSNQELLQIEYTFLKAIGYQLPLHHLHKRPENPKDKNLLFEGLSAVVTFLCELDNQKDIMDCSVLFQYTKKSDLVESIVLS